MDYIQKQIKVRAYQVTRAVEADCPVWMHSPLRDGKIEIDCSLVDGAVRIYGCTVRTPEGKMHARTGDFIVLEPNGSLRVCKNSHFKSLYEKASG